MLSYKSERFNKRTFVESYIIEIFSRSAQVIGTLRYGHYGLRTTSGRESPSHAWNGPTTLKGCENWTVVLC